MKNIMLAPSLLSADLADLKNALKIIEDNGGTVVHIDVMDGIFVPSISFGFPIIRSIRKLTNQFFDVHLMITEPIRYVEEFKKAGADLITIHLEACEDVAATLNKIKEVGCKEG